MTKTAALNKVLVVPGTELLRAENPMASVLLQRALSLAKMSGCELELFHACYDNGVAHQLFASDEEMSAEISRLTDHDARLLAGIATKLAEEGVRTSHDVQWDSPRPDAILRKIAASRPDIVMKQAREHSFVLGITSNTDWELARRSPAHVWFVSAEKRRIQRIVAAVGNTMANVEDITTVSDYELFQTADLLARTFTASIFPVNAYQVPDPMSHVVGGGGVVTPMGQPQVQNQKLREQLVKRHTDAVNALASYFEIAEDNVFISEGNPNVVIPEVAEEVGADMIVMGANSINRLERLVRSVTVEPVMADTHCDIVVVRDSDVSGLDNLQSGEAQRGRPPYDIEQAIIRPAGTFRSPREVIELDASFAIRRRILQAWESDIRSEMVAENEGGPIQEIESITLQDIQEAEALLEQESTGKKKVAHSASA